jgi:hypothetical protein
MEAHVCGGGPEGRLKDETPDWLRLDVAQVRESRVRACPGGGPAEQHGLEAGAPRWAVEEQRVQRDRERRKLGVDARVYVEPALNDRVEDADSGDAHIYEAGAHDDERPESGLP